jgi:large subunit ribosomal protein L25
MNKIILHATPRTITGKKVGALRREGKLPGILYGHQFPSTPVLFDLRETSRALQGLTASSIITVELNGQEHAVLVREKQRDYIRNVLLHVDLQVVSLTEKLRVKVNVELVGTSPAVKDFNGVVVTGIDKIEVEALPQNLPERITVDISKLTKIGDSIYVRDLQIPANVEVLEDPNETIVTIASEMGEETAEESTIAEPEVIERGKKEEPED